MLRPVTSAFYDNLLQRSQNTQSRLQRLQVQVASGQSYERLSELGTSAASNLLTHESVLSQLVQSTQIAQVAQRTLTAAEQSFSSLTTIATTLRSLLISSSALATPSDFGTLAITLQELRNEAAAALNQSFAGRYLFGGSRSDHPPVDPESFSADGPPAVQAFGLSAATASNQGIRATSAISRIAIPLAAQPQVFEVSYQPESSGGLFNLRDLTTGNTLSGRLDPDLPAAGQIITFSSQGAVTGVSLALGADFDPTRAITPQAGSAIVPSGSGSLTQVSLDAAQGDLRDIISSRIDIAGSDPLQASLTLAAHDGTSYEAENVNLTQIGTQSLTLRNATTGATITISFTLNTPFDPTALADSATHIELGDLFATVVIAPAAAADSENVIPPAYYQGGLRPFSFVIAPDISFDLPVSAQSLGPKSLISALSAAITVAQEAQKNGTLPASEVIDDLLEQADVSFQALNQERSAIGVVHNQIETLAQHNEDRRLLLEQSISAIGDADLASVLTYLSQTQLQLEASFQLLAQFGRLTLLEYL